MTDFEFDVRQKKNIAASAKHRKASVRGPRGCSLPSDSLTAAQKKKLDGPISVYRLDQPMKWEEFKALPEDQQAEYLRRLKALYGANDKMLAVMFGVCAPTVKRHREALGVPGAGRGGACHGTAYEKEQERWRRFINNESDDLLDAESEEPDSCEEPVEEETYSADDIDFAAPMLDLAEGHPIRMEHFTTTLTGIYCPEALVAVLGSLPVPNGMVSIHIDVTRID